MTNDIFTREDAEFLIRHEALEAGRIRAVETGGCPHAAIREDISANLLALEHLHESCAPATCCCWNRRRQPRRPLQPRTGRLHDLRDRRGRRRQGPPQGRAGHHAVRSAGHQQDRPRPGRRRGPGGHGPRRRAPCAATGRSSSPKSGAGSEWTKSSNMCWPHGQREQGAGSRRFRPCHAASFGLGSLDARV